MKTQMRTVLAGAALLALGLAALPGRSLGSPPQERDSSWTDVRRAETELQARLARAQAQLAAAQGRLQERLAASQAQLQARLEGDLLKQQTKAYAKLAVAQEAATRAWRSDGDVLLSVEGENGWLGVSIEEITTDKAKELKLSAERGVLVAEVDSDSPAAKAGLKVNDVITDFNGQRVEGTAQFRRLIRETPPGRTVQMNVWRDGRSQSVSAQLGDFGDQMRQRIRVITPRDFNFSFDIPFSRNLPKVFSTPTPLLGIGVQDVSGQLGSYFGAPDGEGVLITEVRSGSPAEKGGLKAGDVITKVDGTRVRTTSDLREQLRAKRDKKSVSITVIRKGSETSLNVEIEQPKPPTVRRPVAYRTLL